VTLPDSVAVSAVAAVWIAFAIDRCFGEPPARWHPVVWMGAFLGWAGARIAPREAGPERDLCAFAAGALAWLAGAGAVAAAAWAWQCLALQCPAIVGALLLGLALKPLLAWRMLREEAAAVEQGLARSLDAGRERLARLVSRDVQLLDATQVRESAIESLAENLNDSVVAPVFWFVLFGLPGAAVYRFANTADAMWGYRGLRHGRQWEWAGKWTAHADDILSWLPARITALLIAVAGGGLRPGVLRQEARRTPSPNGGWPMAAMALVLNVSLRKPGVYGLNGAARPPVAQDSRRAATVAARAVVALVVLASLALGLSVDGGL
jgi:adenosylcobinamide-phosphate synthase